MKTKKQIGLLFVAASILSTSAFAVTTPPSVIDQPIIGAATFALFVIDAKKIKTTPAQALATLKTQLVSDQITPCTVLKDLNYTPITCGAAAFSFGLNQLYSLTAPINLRHLPINFNKGVKQVFAANFLSPDKNIIGDSTGRLVHVKFKAPVTDFAMQVDAGQSLNPSVDSLKFWVVDNTGKRTSSVSVPLTAGLPQWAGIHVPEGTTDLDIEALDGATQAYTLDQIAFK